MTRTPANKMRGFSLLEVLVAVVILSVGLLALASLQLSLIRSSSDSKAQSVALGLVKDKIETLRAFTSLAGYIGITDPANTTSTVGGVTYTLATTVDRFVLDGNTGLFVRRSSDTELESTISADTSIAFVPGRDFKRITSNATWADASGASHSVTLDDVIDGLDPSDSSKVSKTTASSTPRSAKIVILNPASEAGVIPIAISADGNTDTAATNPKPVVDQGANETRFDILTYSAITGDTADRLAQSRVETTVISCSCDTANKPTDIDARGYRPTYWNGFRYVAPTLTTYVPPAGQITFGHSDPAESPYCSSCCRDHHDTISGVTISGAKFDPWRSSHTHYGFNNANVLTAVGVSGQTKYLEACRMIRVDGIYRVAADFNDEYYNLLKTKKNDNLTLEYVPTDSATSHYQAMVLAYLDTKIVSNNSPSTYNNTLSTQQSSPTTVAESAAVTNLESTNSINDPSSIALDRTGYSWLHSRGLYIDYLEAEALAAIDTAKQLCITNSCTTAQKSEAVLKLTPFTSINLTELSNFTPAVTANDVLSVTDGSYFDPANDTGTPIRGKVVPSTTLDSSAHSVTAITSMLTSNSGLVAKAAAIDTDETTKTDSQPYTIPIGVGSSGGSFTVNFTNYDFQVTPQLSGAGFNTCTSADIGHGHTINRQYTCNLVALPTTPLVVAVSNYNVQTAPVTGLSIKCYGDTTSTNTSSLGAALVTHTTGAGLETGDMSLVSCLNYTLSSATTTQGTVTVGSPPTNDGGVTSSESTPVTVSSVTATGETLGLNFSGTTTTTTPTYTCLYTCSNSGCTGGGNKYTYRITTKSSTCP